MPAEEKFKGFGVSACATCDGFFYRGKEVVVIGGGNTAVEEALFLTNFASKVTVVHRRDRFRAETHPAGSPVQESEDRGGVGHVLDEVIGGAEPLKVTGVRAAQRQDRRAPRCAADGVFIAIGHSPATELFKGQLEMKPTGYIETAPYSTATSVAGRVRGRRRHRRHLTARR